MANGVYTVYNIGTGHTSAEENQTMRDLYVRTVPRADCWLNEGITGLYHKATGTGMSPRLNTTIERILEAKPKTLNMTGHSRGATLCYVIANHLTELGMQTGKDARIAGKITSINIFTLDAVNMSSKRHTTHLYLDKVNSHLRIIMENETNWKFPPNIVETRLLDKDLERDANNKAVSYNMPGSHGSGTQFMTSAIGKACRGMIMRHLHLWGTDFTGNRIPGLDKMATYFARIHLENPVEQNKKGEWVRRVLDDTKGRARPKDQKVKHLKFGRDDVITAIYEDAKHNYLEHNYFFNSYHAWCFRKTFPAFARSTFNIGSGDKSKKARDGDLDRMENYPDIVKSLIQQGVIGDN